MKKHIFKFGVISAWVVLLGWWLWQGLPAAAPKEAGELTLNPYEDYFVIKHRDQKIGWAIKKLDKTRQGYRVTEESLSILTVMGREVVFYSRVEADFNQAINLLDFSGQVSIDQAGLNFTGHAADETVNIAADLMGHKEQVSIPSTLGPMLPSGLMPYLARLGILPKARHTTLIINPGKLELNLAEAIVEEMKSERDPQSGDKRPVYRIRLNFSGETSLAWVTQEGRTLREENPALGMVMEKVDNETLAKQGVRTAPPPLAQIPEDLKPLLDKFIKVYKDKAPKP